MIQSGLKKKIKFLLKVNWVKTIYFNFKKFPISTAIILPVFFYGKVKFQNISGDIIINVPIKRGMIGFGQPFEIFKKSKGNAELFLAGKFFFDGFVQFGKDYKIYIDKKAECRMGNMSSLGSDGKIICFNKIYFGDYCRIGYESQVIDTNAHQMIDVKTNEKFPLTAPILLGDYNYFGNRVTVMQNTITPNYCTIASNSLCASDYSTLGENILIGGIPVKLLKSNISRDWEGERENMNKWLKVE